MSEKWLTVRQASELTGYHAVHVRRLIQAGQVKARKFGPVWQVERQALLAYVRQAQKSRDKRRGAKGRRT